MEEVKLIQIEEVKEYAHGLMNRCKEHLLEHGYVPRICHVFTTSDKMLEISKENSSFCEAHHLDQDGNITEPNPDEPVHTSIVMLDLNTNPTSLLNMVAMMEPQFGPKLQSIRMMAAMLQVDDKKAEKRAIDIFIRAANTSESAILGSYMKHMIQKLNAYAYVHQSEQWTAYAEGEKKMPRDLSTYEGRGECLSVIWETFNDGENITVDFEREGGKVGEGKVSKFSEPKVYPTSQYKGRIFNILRNTGN